MKFKLLKMCTKTVRSYTNARYLSSVSPQKFVNYWKCGFCSECIKEKQIEFRVRSYYEAKRCLSDGGFVLFDTLTYSNDNLAFFSDFYPEALYQPYNFACFNHDHISKFFADLRLTLTRLGYECKNEPDKGIVRFRYLQTSEYGSRPGCTHRPHYHILFFVNFDIRPEILSYIIGEVWFRGRTDGIWYKGRRYLNSQRVFRSLSSDLLKVSNYVSKYIGKDLYLYGRLFRRCVASMYRIDPNWTVSYSRRLEFRRLCAAVLPFHLQSDHFGEYALQDVPLADITCEDSLPLPLSSPGVVARIPLPLYYRRKLYYKAVRVDGRLSWCLTDFGRQHRIDSFDTKVRQFSLRLLSFDQHCDADRIARYHLLRRGVLCDRLTASFSDIDFLRVQSVGLSADIDFLRDNGLVYYGYLTDRYKYAYGRCITDSERSGVPWFDRCLERPCRSWSPEEFFCHPPDGLVVLSDSSADAFLDRFFAWLRLNGDSFDFVNYKKCVQADRYKQLGLIDEFSLF